MVELPANFGRLHGDRIEMRHVDDSGNRGNREWARRVEVRVVLRAIVAAGEVTSVTGGGVIQALDDRCLVRTEGQLQAVGLRGQHETDRQERARHQ
jgi:hypothetical protein